MQKCCFSILRGKKFFAQGNGEGGVLAPPCYPFFYGPDNKIDYESIGTHWIALL